MSEEDNSEWPIFIEDQLGHKIYLTWERWDHALGHPGMREELLDHLLETLRIGRRKQDKYDPTKFKYLAAFLDLPMDYTHLEVVVKFGWHGNPATENNFVLTAYLVEKW